VTRVSWFAAKAFADWAGCALPTEARWRAAAAGKPAAAGERAIRVSPAGTSPGMVAAGSADAAAVSWGGKPVLHLGGNVAEWCADVYLPPGPRDNVLAGQLRAEPYRRPVRGDSFMNGGIPCGADCAIIADPQLCAPDVGFRVARGR
jgi:formylglycine-generating enzyme required for sulfatase activity